MADEKAVSKDAKIAALIAAGFRQEEGSGAYPAFRHPKHTDNKYLSLEDAYAKIAKAPVVEPKKEEKADK